MIRYTPETAEELHRLVYYTNVVDAGLHQHVVIHASREIFAALARLKEYGFDPFRDRPPELPSPKPARQAAFVGEGGSPR